MELRKRLSSFVSSLGGIIGACSCTTMILASLAGLAGLFGMTVSLTLPGPFISLLDVTAQPLLILSLVLIVFGTMGSHLPLALSLIGAPSTYAGMFLIPGGMANVSAHLVHAGNPLALSVFWLGVVLLATSIILMRHEGVMPAKPTKGFAWVVIRRLVASTALVGLILTVSTFALGPLSSSQLPLRDGADQPLLEVKSDQDNFVWRGRVIGYTKEESYFPRFSATKATITINHKMTLGELTLGVMDGAGSWILRDKTIRKEDSPTVTLTTQAGRPGTWMVILEFSGTTGELEIRLTP